MQAHGIRQIQTREDEQAYENKDQPDKSLGYPDTENVEETTVTVRHWQKKKKEATVVAYYWCRVCKLKTPATEAKSCDCGVTMCNRCWGEWDFICPLCDSDMS